MAEYKKSVRFIPQHDQMDCGPACLAMVASAYSKRYSLQFLRDNSFLTKEGVSLLGIGEAAERIGMEKLAVKIPIEDLGKVDYPLPAILHWNQNHFVVLKSVSKNIITRKKVYKIADPSYGNISITQDKLRKSWIADNDKGIALFLLPTDNFYNLEPPKEKRVSLKYLLNYLTPHKKSVYTIFILLLFSTFISLGFPFLTQKLIDKGVNAKDLNIITLILIAQLCLFIGNLVIELIRNWIMLVIGTKLNIKIISDFILKLLKLPIKFFDTKLMGDYNQRIADHERIEDFLTSQSLLTFFSIITFSVFFFVLWYFDTQILLIYLGLSIIAISWSLFWMRKRKILDYFRFQLRSENQEAIYEIINGVSEIKINQMEEYKQLEWESIQQKLFNINVRALKLSQIQILGFDFVNQFKNILVTFIAASLVVKGEITLGTLLSISYIIGQMNSPINMLMGFFRSYQDASLSFERLNDIQNNPDEDSAINRNNECSGNLLKEYPDFNIQNLNFQYEGPNSKYVLENINLSIPYGKITAIVGASGSGKTTLIKLLLKFYEPTRGQIFLGKNKLSDISHRWLRENSGVVMQDGYIFGDTIQNNIVCGNSEIDEARLYNAVKLANIKEFIEGLPLGLNSKIGASGNSISGGQKQRLLIARAIYKNPHFIFLDEATNALDSNNEKIILDNLNEFYNGKTVIVVAHRLSTVRNADQIIVLDNGKIAEKGSHKELISLKGKYYDLVKNQLELGN